MREWVAPNEIIAAAMMRDTDPAYGCYKAPDAGDMERKHDHWLRDRHERNCNSCRHLIRDKHPKSPFGFLQGRCPTNPEGFTFHPHDVMLKGCYGPRLSKHSPQYNLAPNIKEPPTMTRRIAIAAIALAAGCAIGAGLGLIWAASVL